MIHSQKAGQLVNEHDLTIRLHDAEEELKRIKYPTILITNRAEHMRHILVAYEKVDDLKMELASAQTYAGFLNDLEEEFDSDEPSDKPMEA